MLHCTNKTVPITFLDPIDVDSDGSDPDTESTESTASSCSYESEKNNETQNNNGLYLVYTQINLLSCVFIKLFQVIHTMLHFYCFYTQYCYFYQYCDPLIFVIE